IHVTGASDEHLQTLLELTQKGEPAVAREATIAIGRDWLANPNRILFGMSGGRRKILESLTRSSDLLIAQNAARHLLASRTMGLGERFYRSRKSYFARYLSQIKYQTGLEE